MALDTVTELRKAIQAKSTRKVFVHVSINPNYAPGIDISKAAAIRMLKGIVGSMKSPYAQWLDENETLLDIGGFRNRTGSTKCTSKPN